MARELLFSVTKKDLDINFFSGTGKGGQNRNKHQNCVRMTHRDSGVTTTAQRERSREQNLRQAFEALNAHPTFKAWHRKKCAEMMMTREEKEREKKRIDELVDESMKEENLKIEVKDEKGDWTQEEKIKVLHDNGILMTFTDIYSNDSNLCGCLNGIDANEFFTSEIFEPKFTNCISRIGGFTDSAFFNMEEIKGLSGEDTVEFMYLLEEGHEEWEKMLKDGGEKDDDLDSFQHQPRHRHPCSLAGS